MKFRNVVALAGMCALAAFSTVSRADLLFQITSDHCSNPCLTGQTSGGTIQVTDNGGGKLTFTVHLLNGNQFLQTGQDASFAFNLSASSVNFGGLTAGWAAVGGNNPVAAASLHMDGTGFFSYGVTCEPVACGPGGSSPAGSNLSFFVQAAGLTLASLTANSNSQYFGIDIISGNTGNPTGFVDASTPTVCTPPVCNPQNVPEPATLALLGIALLGMSVPAIRRRRMN